MVPDLIMSTSTELRAKASAKREEARVLRTIAPGMSLAGDRSLLTRQADQLEADAARLDAQAQSDL